MGRDRCKDVTRYLCYIENITGDVEIIRLFSFHEIEIIIFDRFFLFRKRIEKLMESKILKMCKFINIIRREFVARRRNFISLAFLREY